MFFLTIAVAFLLSFFATAINSYIALSTSLGPWIEATLVLGGMLIFYLFNGFVSQRARTQSLGLATAAGGIGGILATACGFSFPTLFFIDNAAFCSLMSSPFSFALFLSCLALAAGSLGLMLATIFEHSLIEREALPFPIGELVYKMISVGDSMRKAVSLAVGFLGTQAFLLIRSLSSFAPKQILLFPKYSLGFTTVPQIAVQTDLLPMYWAIGFVTGHVIAIPLLLGFLANILVIEPLHYIYPWISTFLYEHGLSKIISAPAGSSLSLRDFTVAFCSGMVIYGAMTGFLELPKLVRSVFSKFFHIHKERTAPKLPWLLIGGTLFFNGLFLTAVQFSWSATLYLVTFTLVCIYQMMLIAGKIGLAPLGRFATFVMVPGMFLFGYTPLQITVVATYVEIAGGVACDCLFGRKMAQLADIDAKRIQQYQWFGLVVSSLLIGGIFWLLISHFGIGNEPGALPASRAAYRALLVNVQRFDTLALLLGLIFGYLLKFVKVNSALMLGGILMPAEASLMLIIGGLSTYLVKDKEEYYPFWSGVFAANSLWMLIKAFF